MVCKFCGQELADGAVICTGCGRALNVESSSENLVNTGNSSSVTSSKKSSDEKKAADEKSSLPGIILSFLWPAAGLVLWLIWRKKFPKTARHCKIAAIISLVSSFVIGFLYGIFSMDWGY